MILPVLAKTLIVISIYVILFIILLKKRKLVLFTPPQTEENPNHAISHDDWQEWSENLHSYLPDGVYILPKDAPDPSLQKSEKNRLL
jgi:hypothetical protein